MGLINPPLSGGCSQHHAYLIYSTAPKLENTFTKPLVNTGLDIVYLYSMRIYHYIFCCHVSSLVPVFYVFLIQPPLLRVFLNSVSYFLDFLFFFSQTGT